jgi:hypothetical protein
MVWQGRHWGVKKPASVHKELFLSGHFLLKGINGFNQFEGIYIVVGRKRK